MPYRRTIRKPTRWTPDEWRQIEEAAQARGVPALRYVREAALAAKLPPRAQTRARARRGAHELVRQLKRVLNNLNQLHRLAEELAMDADALALEAVIRTTEAAVKTAAAYRGPAADALTAGVVDAGRVLNELTHGAHSDEDLPPPADLSAALRGVLLAVQQVGGA